VTCTDQSDLYHQNSAVFKNFVLYSPDPPSVCTEGLGRRLLAYYKVHPDSQSITDKPLVEKVQGLLTSSVIQRPFPPPVFNCCKYGGRRPGRFGHIQLHVHKVDRG